MSRRRTLVVLLIITLISIFIRMIWLHSAIERDEGMFAYAGWRMNEGERLYIDISENKPPLIFLTYSAMISLFGNSIIPIRLLNNALFLVSLVYMYLIGKEHFDRRTSYFILAVYSVFMNLPVFEGQLAMTESFANFFIIASFYYYTKYEKDNSRTALSGSLLLSLIAVLFNIYSSFYVIFLVVQTYLRKRMILREIWVFLAIVAFLTASVPLLARDIFLNLLKVFSFHFASAFGNYIPFSYFKLIMIEGIFIWFLMAIGMILSVKEKTLNKGIWLLLMLMFSSVIIPSSFGHYWIRLSLPASLIAGYGLSRIVVRLKERKDLLKDASLLFIVCLAFLVTSFFVLKHYPTSNINHGDIRWSYSGEVGSYQKQIEISTAMKRVTGSDDTIGIWGWDGSLWFLSERKFSGIGNFYWQCPDRILPEISRYEELLHEPLPSSSQELEDKILGTGEKRAKAVVVFNMFSRDCSIFNGTVFDNTFENWSRKEFGDITLYYDHRKGIGS